MTAREEIDAAWDAANHRHLVAALDELRGHLLARLGEPHPAAAPASDEDAAVSTLSLVGTIFGLSRFERTTLLLAAGAELASDIAALCGRLQGDPARPWLSFGLALHALPEAHWSALAPSSPLRYWRLVSVDADAGLTAGRLTADERILHLLTGIDAPDDRLAARARALPEAEVLAPSHAAAAGRIAALWQEAEGGTATVILLHGPDPAARTQVAAMACGALEMEPLILPVSALPPGEPETTDLLRLAEREALLSDRVLVVEAEDDTPEDRLSAALAGVAGTLRSPLILSLAERRPVPGRPVFTVEIALPPPAEQRLLWQAALGPVAGDAAVAPAVAGLAHQFRLGLPALRAAAAEARAEAGGDPAALGPALWRASRERARPRLDDLAQRIEAAAGWDDLVLPEAQAATLRAVAGQIRHRATVHEDWGFEAPGARGLGLTALFSGSSGTGKTTAAEVLAREAGLDLFRIDLSAVVSKYIGETEKNLRRVFDAAEAGGAVLLFDEADALFGKRSEVKDSHDRFANIEVSYLLQRMESYRGLAILTTNQKEALDRAFQRRLRFIVEFPFPDAALRAELWRRAFPPGVPLEGVDPVRLAQLNLAGGNIRNLALNAAFAAAAADGPVTMGHLREAARLEYEKLGRQLTDAETKGWT